MAIPTDRQELRTAIDTTYGKLCVDLDRLTASQAREVCVDDWTVVDVLTVRTWWARAVVGWIEAGQRGEVPQTPAPGYSWRETPRLNTKTIADAPKRRSWKRVRAEFEDSHDAVIATLEQLSDPELEQVGQFEWAGRWPVLRWVSISTATGYASSRTYVRALLRRLEA